MAKMEKFVKALPGKSIDETKNTLCSDSSAFESLGVSIGNRNKASDPKNH